MEAIPRTKVTIPRVFHHMRQVYRNKQELPPNKADMGKAPPFYSSKLPPDKLHGAQGVIEEMNQSRKITPGHITPKLPRRLSKKLNSELDIYEPERLCRHILRYCGFDERGFSYGGMLSSPVLVNDWALRDERGRFIGDERIMEYAMLIQTFQILQLSYNGVQRESGNPWESHPLRAALFVAALGAPVEMVISALLHDILEDAMSKDMPKVKFRAFERKNGELVLVELTGEEGILGYMRKNYWRYGSKIAWDVLHDTRNDIRKEIMNATYVDDPAEYEKLYKKHLHKAHTRIGSAFGKAGDAKANITEISSIMNPEVRGMKFDKRMLKLDWQLECGWDKIAWPVFESLLYDLSVNSAEERTWKKYRFVPAESIWKFADGYNLVGTPHRYNQELRGKIMPSRSPTIEIYFQGNKPSFIFEFPFIREAKVAIGIIKDVFRKNIIKEPKEVDSLLPLLIRDAVLVSVDFRENPKVEKFICMVAAYDEPLKDLIDGGFVRKERTDAAWARHYMKKKELGL